MILTELYGQDVDSLPQEAATIASILIRNFWPSRPTDVVQDDVDGYGITGEIDPRSGDVIFSVSFMALDPDHDRTVFCLAVEDREDDVIKHCSWLQDEAVQCVLPALCQRFLLDMMADV